MNEEQLKQYISQHSKKSTSPRMAQALIDVIVSGKKWRIAARDNDVSESGILRAIRRLGLQKSSP